MKKLVAAALASAMVYSLCSVAFAAVDTSGPKLKKEDVQLGVNFISAGGYEGTYEDFFSIDYGDGMLVPGKTYYFPCDWAGEDMDEEFFDLYSVSISIASSDPDELSNSNAKKYIKEAKFEKNNQGIYFFKVTASQSYSYVNDVGIKIVVVAKGKSNPDYRDWEEFDLDIGYAQNNTVNEVYAGTDEYDVDNSAPIVEFDTDVKTCRLNFEDESFYYASFSNRVTKMNLLHTEDANAVVKSGNPSATLKFLSFPTKPSFVSSGAFRFYAPGKSYLYQISDDNKLTLLSSNNKDGYFAFSTAQLGSYVASDKALTSSGTGAQTQTPAPTTPPSTTPPQGGGHFNPGTGAAL